MKFILVHGLGHGGWCWEKTRTELEKRGHEVVAPDLPLTSLSDDADSVAQLVEAHSPAVVVGHSYGGLVISFAAARTAGTISHLVYLAAAMVSPEEDYLAIVAEHATPLSEKLIENDGTWLTVSPEIAAEAFYNECDEETTRTAVARLRPTSVNCHIITEPLPTPWQGTDSMYIVCARDSAMPPGAQRVLAKKAAHIAEMDTDHSPFLSANEELCDLLLGYAGADLGFAAG
jgi:pimeloyl-ACP methyl ester carboxylesterase